jgi:pimeloyl-ACP methyl ester carboxylesterase
MTTFHQPLVGFTAMALLLACGQRETPPDRLARQAGDTAQTASRSVGTVKAPDGVAIRYEVAGRGEPTLVFVHGWSCDRSYWRPQIDHFARSHQVVAVDLGGHGESGVERKDWTMAAFAGDVRAVVEGLGLQKVVLVGHSMGGPVILEAARLMPERVVALIPVDFFNDVDRGFTAKEREGFLTPMRTDFRRTTAGFVRKEMFTPRADSAMADRIAQDMAAGSPAVAVSAMSNLLQYDQGAAIAATKVPLRLINSDLWPTDLEALRRHNPNIGLAVVPGVGHFLMMEAPDEFNRILARAVRELVRT